MYQWADRKFSRGLHSTLLKECRLLPTYVKPQINASFSLIVSSNCSSSVGDA